MRPSRKTLLARLTTLVGCLCWVSSHATAASTGNCSSGYFPCYDDCCEKGVWFCNTAERERRCEPCELRKHECGTHDVHVHCLLYCHKLLLATTTTAPASPDANTKSTTALAEGRNIPVSDLSLETRIAIIVAVIFAVVSILACCIFYLCFPTTCRERLSERSPHRVRRLCHQWTKSTSHETTSKQQALINASESSIATDQNSAVGDFDHSLRHDNHESSPLAGPASSGDEQQPAGDATADQRALNLTNFIRSEEEDPLLRGLGNGNVVATEGEMAERSGTCGGEPAVEQLHLNQRGVSDDDLSTSSSSSREEVTSPRAHGRTASVTTEGPAAGGGFNSAPSSVAAPGHTDGSIPHPQRQHCHASNSTRAPPGQSSSANHPPRGQDTEPNASGVAPEQGPPNRAYHYSQPFHGNIHGQGNQPNPGGVALEQPAPSGAHRFHHSLQGDTHAYGYPVSSLNPLSMSNARSSSGNYINRSMDYNLSSSRTGAETDPSRDHYNGLPIGAPQPPAYDHSVNASGGLAPYIGAQREPCRDMRLYTNPTKDADGEHEQRVVVATGVQNPVAEYNSPVNPQP